MATDSWPASMCRLCWHWCQLRGLLQRKRASLQRLLQVKTLRIYLLFFQMTSC
jgi:hypothetical protein